MAVKSRGRGLAAALGLFVLFAGLVGGAVLYIVAQQRPAQAVDGFARAPVGCTTTLEFTETGDFFVFEEVGAAETVEGCQPVATPGADFAVDFTGDLFPADVDADASISYDVDGFDGRSVERISITEPGQYTVEVTGDDLTVVAALGRDPGDGVSDLRRNALVVAIVGIAAGLLLLVLSGRRSKRAATVSTPDGPGRGPVKRSGDWPPDSPRLDQVPVNPHLPGSPANAEMSQSAEAPATWQPPTGDVAEDMPAPDLRANDTSASPESEPVLPDTPGRPSGT